MTDSAGTFFFMPHCWRPVTLFIVLLLVLLPSFGKIRLPSFVSDQMVLQRGTELDIWGWATKGEKVTHRFRGVYYYTEAGSDGKWKLTMPQQHYVGPYVMEINGLVIRDILIGDVWLCSGQSNMETPIQRLVERFPEIAVSNNHMIRYFKVPTQNSVLETLIDSDSVYINGHFVGATSYRYPPRVYDVSAGILHKGDNTVTIRLRKDGLDGGFTSDKMYRLQVDDSRRIFIAARRNPVDANLINKEGLLATTFRTDNW
ncbi:hypothetical protein D7322_08065 [Sphingobacterium puteale]|uniref:Sialate O-acetylesterase n=1 Tax=Sphingobacterium puteale TaxID=2420510 RepID=A0A420W0F1_9SPHI|nr:hypothetical protein [Sphingobacterium puteale]RKO72048.1 hypothetical protein D7322_08065 [Sphingobacterium puteale]